MPFKTKDAEYQVHIDVGRCDPSTKCLNVVSQVKSQAKRPGSVDWIEEKSTHSKLAAATLSMNANDKNAELNRVLDVLKGKQRRISSSRAITPRWESPHSDMVNRLSHSYP